MDRSEVIKRIQSRTTSLQDFNWDTMIAPPLLSLLSIEDINYFRKLATSVRYSSKIDFKYSEIDKIMKMRGFRKLSAGTNRVCYRYLDNDSIVVKIAIDDVGIKDNPREYKNQFYLKPYVTKIFEVSPCGTVALVERVDNITSREEFISIAGHVFDVISNWVVGKYILEDIGSEYFMNWGVRTKNMFGPVLLDFPYMYELDGNKLYCSLPLDNDNPTDLCGGIIDYDDGFNNIKCTKCGATYRAIELQKALENNLILEKGKAVRKMKIKISNGSKEKVISSEQATKKIETRREKKYKRLKPIGSTMKVKITDGDNGFNNIKCETVIGNTREEYHTSSKFIPTKEEDEETEIIEAMEAVNDEDIKAEEVETESEETIEEVSDIVETESEEEEVTIQEDEVIEEEVSDIVEAEEETVEEDIESEEEVSDDEVESEEVETETKEFEMEPVPVGAGPAPISDDQKKRPHQRSARFSEDFYKR